ncbi:MAG: T9SS type A sorting domain-containing protein [Calditrichaeota bacterium]|nr:T9SS type A sorting domain-containing protein [Calditrichota bacterium]MCB9368614.1 T9SS type A sorting domain-containing protein [Calditrichota bacterium]
MDPRKLFTSTLLLLLANFAFASQEYSISKLVTGLHEGPALKSGDFSGWTCMRARDFDGYALYIGSPVDFSAALSDESLVQSVAASFGISSQLEQIKSNTTPTRRYLINREMRDHLPVIGGRFDVALNTKHQVARVSYTTFQDWQTTGSFSLTQYVAATYLAPVLEPANWQVDDEETFACWYPDADARVLRAAYWIRVAGPRPHQRHFGIVDASTGEILLEWPGIAHDVIDLNVKAPFWQPYDHSETEYAPCSYQRVTVNGSAISTDVNGNLSREAATLANVTARLEGQYVEVGERDEGNTPDHLEQFAAPFNGDTLAWTTEDATRPALNLYYHTNFVHDWYKVLDPPYNSLDYPVPAVANYGGNYDNAFWNGFGTYYGGGMNYGNFGMYSDVIYHEYTHGVTDGIYPVGLLPYVDQPGAMNEAWSDYFACTINGDPLMGEWLTGNARSNFRDLESMMVYPLNWVGEVHGDSPFISAPLWTIREELGAGYSDSLGHFARYALTELFYDYFVAVLETDDIDGDLSNGTPNDFVIYDAFGVHGIGPGARPHFVVQNVVFDDNLTGNNNGFAEPGETVMLTFTLFNDVTLYPPAATNVTLTATAADSTLNIGSASFSLGTLAPRDSISVGPIEINIDWEAQDHWGVLNLSIAADQIEEPYEYPFEFSVGIPKVQVVTRSLTSNVDAFVTSTLRSMDKVFEHKRLSSGQQLDLSMLPDTGTVLWLSGNGTTSGMTANDRAQLTDFLSGGGKLVMSGKHILRGLESTTFASDVLNANVGGVSQLRMATTLALPFVAGDRYLLTGAGGAANQDSMTILSAVNGALPVLRYGLAGENVSGVVNAAGNALVFGFGIEAVSDNSPVQNQSRALFLTRILEWAGFAVSAVDNEGPAWKPDDLALTAAYPNPFNSTVRLDYQLGNQGDARLLIYDVLGREVHRAALAPNSNTYFWNPSLASGVYFAVVKSDSRVTRPQKLMLLR